MLNATTDTSWANHVCLRCEALMTEFGWGNLCLRKSFLPCTFSQQLSDLTKSTYFKVQPPYHDNYIVFIVEGILPWICLRIAMSGWSAATSFVSHFSAFQYQNSRPKKSNGQQFPCPAKLLFSNLLDLSFLCRSRAAAPVGDKVL